MRACTGVGVFGTPGTGIDGELRRLGFAISAERHGVARVDPSLTRGLPMVLVGMTTVFAALAALVGLIALTTRLLSRSQPKTSARPVLVPAAAPRVNGSSAEREASEDALLRAALAAFSVHQMRRANAAPPITSSAWTSAGRMQQIAPFRR
jgi:Na+-transporting methylmalonyl-CoA/oxaloacetate decarboxylase gamma subunit